MKHFKIILAILFGFAQFAIAQEWDQGYKPNSMSNVIGATFDGGVTLSLSDYSSNVMDYFARGSLEYYLPSTGNGNIGLRVFAHKGFIAGKDAPSGSGNPTNEFNTRIDMYGGGIFYTLSMFDYVYPWFAVGASYLLVYPKDANGNYLPNYSSGSYRNSMLAYNADAGLRFIVAQNLSANFTAGIVIASEDNLDDIKAGSSNDKFITASAGLSWYFGRASDSDGDGVRDSRDMCPNTPVNVKVDDDGCPLDADSDGVPDYLDRCPFTPSGVKVDQDGCPLDADGDGVPDDLDKCSNTPAGVKVNEHGCPLDADGDGVTDDLDKCSDSPSGVKVDEHGCPLDSDVDGVPDYLDKCSNTPAGVKVDQNGCPFDADGDGVPDYLDKCSNTPKGVEVDTQGCEISKKTVTIIKPGEAIVLSGDTNFEYNKSKLLPSAYDALKDVVKTMNEHPEYKWEIGGHTDGVGSDSYNKNLSRERAQAVVDYLVRNGVKRNNLSIVGYGKDSPIATNDTNEGRSMNRRVEIKLLSTK